MHKIWHHGGFGNVRSVVLQMFWNIGLKNALLSLKNEVFQSRSWHEQWILKCQTYQRVDCKEWSTFSAIVEWTTLDLSRRNTSGGQRITGILCSPVPAPEQFTWNICQHWTHKFYQMPYINLWLDDVIRKQFCQTMLFISCEQLKKFVSYSPLWRKLNWKKIKKLGINPPGSQHFGGAWECLVRSCKEAMWNLSGLQPLKEKQLTTIISSVERLSTTVNIRHLTVSSNRTEDSEALLQTIFSWEYLQLTIQMLFSLVDPVAWRRLSRHIVNIRKGHETDGWRNTYHSWDQSRSG